MQKVLKNTNILYWYILNVKRISNIINFIIILLKIFLNLIEMSNLNNSNKIIKKKRSNLSKIPNLLSEAIRISNNLNKLNDIFLKKFDLEGIPDSNDVLSELKLANEQLIELAEDISNLNGVTSDLKLEPELINEFEN